MSASPTTQAASRQPPRQQPRTAGQSGGRRTWPRARDAGGGTGAAVAVFLALLMLGAGGAAGWAVRGAMDGPTIAPCDPAKADCARHAEEARQRAVVAAFLASDARGTRRPALFSAGEGRVAVLRNMEHVGAVGDEGGSYTVGVEYYTDFDAPPSTRDFIVTLRAKPGRDPSTGVPLFEAASVAQRPGRN